MAVFTASWSAKVLLQVASGATSCKWCYKLRVVARRGSVYLRSASFPFASVIMEKLALETLWYLDLVFVHRNHKYMLAAELFMEWYAIAFIPTQDSTSDVLGRITSPGLPNLPSMLPMFFW